MKKDPHCGVYEPRDRDKEPRMVPLPPWRRFPYPRWYWHFPGKRPA